MKRYILKLSILIFGASFALVPAGVAIAQCDSSSTSSSKAAIQGGVNCVGGSNANPSQATSSINNTIRQVINIISLIGGIAAVIMIVVGGFRYITSGGDAAKVASAKNTLLYAIIGLIIVALAQVIVRFVLKQTTSTVSSSGSSSQSSGSGGSTPCAPLPSGGCAPGTGP